MLAWRYFGLTVKAFACSRVKARVRAHSLLPPLVALTLALHCQMFRTHIDTVAVERLGAVAAFANSDVAFVIAKRCGKMRGAWRQ